jgi:ubiquinone/menaquinone biosynthesis C-methylase UbiE
MKTGQDNPQIREWKSDFGREYTERNTLDPTALDALYHTNYGMSRSQLNREFLMNIPAEARILEVGFNVGNQLLMLAQAGYSNLFGIEIQRYAVDKARKRLPNAVLAEGSLLDIPYPDQHFDLVFTSGVLIHIAPAQIHSALDEIYRTAKTWIWAWNTTLQVQPRFLIAAIQHFYGKTTSRVATLLAFLTSISFEKFACRI